MSDPIKYSKRATEVKRLSAFSRRIQIFTWFTVAFAGGYMVLFNDYSATLSDQSEKTQARGHVFSGIQAWVKEKTNGKPFDPEPASKS